MIPIAHAILLHASENRLFSGLCRQHKARFASWHSLCVGAPGSNTSQAFLPEPEMTKLTLDTKHNNLFG
ncbi:hypothetical protein CupriaWKF_11735 [Cupriavidus sp. WKF15]|uniref:hypothetical protein n=1 Tax=Cupriavidus sp. WKF15 TaxID=3032282 RepID=UPI0023E1B9B1|nr:hypothetical protein [Cupriavidus sp. WKF15]WER44984.1 hypothetical protein CupriaWKF_11735 [Cupriavidus sp. WKF15]